MKYRWLCWVGNMVRMLETPRIRAIWRTKKKTFGGKRCGKVHME
jgi:hypothetical protein